MIVEDSSFDKGWPFDSVYNEQLDSLVKRLKVLEGAKSIGDDNPSIQNEMKTIIHQLYQKGVFSTGYYNQFKVKMSFPILLNLNNQVSTNQYKYTFSQPIDFSQYEVALGSISIYYSWRAITAQRGNNTFKVIWPTASSTTTYTITLPDGTYTANDINNYLQYFCIQNNLYLINNTTGSYYYFISCAENPSSYAIQFTMQSVKNLTGYTAASGFPTMPVTAYTPQLQIVDSLFGAIVGLTPATSNLIPQVDPVAAVIVGLSNLYNPIANNNQVFHTFTAAGVEYGALITTTQGQGIAYCPMQGTNSEITLSFYTQDMLPLQILDNNVCIRLLMRPARNKE
ncbi:TPA: hypothetical protein N0F65_011649 [Lagenidium giganteum]|uniref:Uncharacterized protein n=1 Tax=Lagenidium giganteum TaxID=4803 RepID=A0AAV2ZFU8_9STRA|nr:TPA: hypothetical protein N0F65_011649 [Lagenidium giganteum]